MATTVVFLTSASTSPWSRPQNWGDVGHQVEMVGAGGNGATNSTSAAGAGGGGAYAKLTWLSGLMGTTTPFAVKAAGTDTTSPGTATATYWEGTTNTNSYPAFPGLAAVTRTGGTGGAVPTRLWNVAVVVSPCASVIIRVSGLTH